MMIDSGAVSAAEDVPVNSARDRPRPVAVARAGRLLRMLFSLAVESLCPLAILAILIDCTRRVGWTYYERDPSIYASIARYWQDGLIPYRDVWEFKPPLIFVALRAGFALWGYEAESLRRILMILTALGALSLYLGLRRARCLIAAPVAALGLMTLVVVNPWGDSRCRIRNPSLSPSVPSPSVAPLLTSGSRAGGGRCSPERVSGSRPQVNNPPCSFRSPWAYSSVCGERPKAGAPVRGISRSAPCSG